MTRRVLLPALTLLFWSLPFVAEAQTPVPTAQPAVLTIFREQVKYGHGAEHETLEAGWPAAYAKAKSPATYIAMTSLTGPSEAWFMAPYANWQAYGDVMKAERGDPVLAAELARLSKADAEHVDAARELHLAGRPDMSMGAFPNIAKQRFYQVTFFRVRPGHRQGFEELAKVFKAAYQKAAPAASYRVYEVVAGMPGLTYMIFSSVQTLAEWDQAQAMDTAVMGSLNASDLQAFQKFLAEGLINSETQRFAVSGSMSYVDDATASQDPAFWRPGVKASK